MWSTIKDILLSPNATIILVFLCFVLLFGGLLSKTGLLNIHTAFVQIGAAGKERDVIRRQIEWIRIHCKGLESQIPKPEDYNVWRGKYIAERVYDEYVDWITFNHLTTTEPYIEIKQDQIVSLVSSLVTKDEFRTKEFENFLRKDTKESIEKLVQIREMYQKEARA